MLQSQIENWNKLCLENNFKIPHKIVEGGNTRFHSVKNGLENVDNNSIVAIHDGVRPLISENLINSLIKEGERRNWSNTCHSSNRFIRKVEGECSSLASRQE